MSTPQKAISQPKSNSMQIVIRNFSKGIFFYPLMVYSFIAWIIEMVFEIENPTAPYNSVLAVIWIFIFLANLFVITFDITTGKFLIIIMIIVAIVLILVISFITGKIEFLKIEAEVLNALHPRLNAQSYLYLTIGIAFIILLVIIQSRFQYIKIEQNEVHIVGILGTDRRFPTASLRIKKEISDVFEWLALRSGSITFFFDKEEPIVMDTVLNVKKIEKRIDELLSTLRVQQTR